ncbi:hypothetical protein NBRC10512v2_006373 [Rhodotorula toruloides]
MSSQAADTLNPYTCRWRYCTEAFSSSAELRDHVMRHVDESEPQRPQPVPTQGGEVSEEDRPAPHGEQSFPQLREGAVLEPGGRAVAKRSLDECTHKLCAQ